MSTSSRSRGGLQVVRVSQEPGRRLLLDEEALESVLLQPEVRNLPVVVVSVTGIYRGGKSFILDFFLRYLMAPVESQLTSAWLENENATLEGFDWRGGGESNTKGIHLWPEPIIVTSGRTGEKVAVLLMDTQGTFDTESDMGDNSTIFALSTLLSSVQIYNIRANIGEDDLQHLQLFTEYGRLACNAEEKAFQTLLFLVRDWMSSFEHPYGYAGGQALLKKRLMPKQNQKKQLREVRDRISLCFEKLQCFLMPHPGLIVADEQFKGNICDIHEEFRLSLLELVPSLFNSINLTPKIINGVKVSTQGLLEFFKQYVEIFNGNDLPEASTISQATAEAGMMFVFRESRERYESEMEHNIVEGKSVSTSIMYCWHDEAVAAAFTCFHGKKKLGSEENASAHLVDLQKELDARLAVHLWQNDAKVRNTLSESKKMYEDTVRAVCQEQACLCLHAQDLYTLHLKALEAALVKFDSARAQVPQEVDPERQGLIENLEKYYKHLCAVNEQNNRSATLEAREVYLTQMKDEDHQNGVSSEELRRHHEEALKTAVRHFQSLRNHATQETVDPDLQRLEQLFTEYGRLACNAEEKAFQTLLFLVRDWMSSFEHPYGYAGGQALLKKRLMPKQNQKKQLREVRDRISLCFEKLQCFLMPHPGLIVADEQFKGNICDIHEEFRLSLLELVPSLFNSINLTPKIINGVKVSTQGLLEFFKQYVEIFNGNDLPEASTISQATAEAGMMFVFRESRERYESEMEHNIVEGKSVSTSIMYCWHDEAVAAAFTCFHGKKKLGSEENASAHLVDLQKELDARLAVHLWQNDAKVRNTLSESKKMYEDTVRAVCQEQACLCLHAQDLYTLHLKALEAALVKFDSARAQVPQEVDPERQGLIENLEKYYKHLCAVNEQNNRSATLEAREVYLTQMKDEDHQNGVSSEELRRHHEEALKTAVRHFQSLRNHATQETVDPDLQRLEQETEAYFRDFETANVRSNFMAMLVAEQAYNNCISLAWGPESYCFHPYALKELHDDAQARAVEQFLSNRVNSEQDDYKDLLIANLEARYAKIQEINDFNNRQAVEQAYIEYMREMDRLSGPGLLGVNKSQLIACFILKVFAFLPMHNDKAKQKALNVFKEKRRGRSYDDDDEYLRNLNKKIGNAFTEYQNPLNAAMREIGL